MALAKDAMFVNQVCHTTRVVTHGWSSLARNQLVLQFPILLRLAVVLVALWFR